MEMYSIKQEISFKEILAIELNKVNNKPASKRSKSIKRGQYYEFEQIRKREYLFQIR